MFQVFFIKPSFTSEKTDTETLNDFTPLTHCSEDGLQTSVGVKIKTEETYQDGRVEGFRAHLPP